MLRCASTFALVIALAIMAPPVSAASQLTIHVDDGASPGGNGSSRRPYTNLPDAVAAARATAGAVVIKVEPGDYPLAETLLIDRSIDLRGSTEQVDSDDPWPTGQVEPGTETRVFSTNPGLVNMILVGRGDLAVLNHVTISGFVFQASTTTISVLLTRVQDYRIADNMFRAPASFGMQSVASSGRVTGNHFSGVGTGAIFTGGFAASPSNVVFAGNRSVRNTLGGVLLNGASIRIPELGDQLDAVVRDNDLSENTGAGEGFGLRIFILRRDLGAPGDTQSAANVKALVQGNRIDGNRLGVVIDAGFPYRQVGSVCDSRVYSGTMDLAFMGNTLTDSRLTPALVTFTRNASALNPSVLQLWQYMHSATYSISDIDGTLAGAWIDHPTSDPFLGPCPGDSSNETLGNVLIYNGAVVPNGKNF
jgi:hypothetical protein